MTGIERFDVLSDVPADALKEITGGNLKGFSDINPQWRIRRMTEVYGQCGDGWKISKPEFTVIDGVDGEKMVHCTLGVSIYRDQNWGPDIPGVGGSKLIKKQTSGLKFDDEAFKMAETDALSVAFKKLGVASIVYEGKWDSKYSKDEPFRKDSKLTILEELERSNLSIEHKTYLQSEYNKKQNKDAYALFIKEEIKRASI